jgi:hypothetical protein
MVVGRKPRAGPVRLVDGERTVVGADPTEGQIPGGQPAVAGYPVVGDGDPEPGAGGDGGRWRHDEFGGGPVPARRGAVDRHGIDGQALEVEVEGREGRRRGRVDGGRAREHAGRGVGRQRQVVVVDLVAGVAEVGVQRVADAGGGRPLPRRRGRRHDGRRGRECRHRRA